MGGSNSTETSSEKTHVVHMIGSSTSDYYYQLSIMYAQACIKAASADSVTMDEFVFSYAFVHPPKIGKQATWSFPSDLSENSIKNAKQFSHAEGIQKFGKMRCDVVVPHMYCLSGLTQYRTLCDLLGFPYLGPDVDAQSIAENKYRTKISFKAAGVPVPEGEVLVQGQNQTPSISVPFVVKPCCEGNSNGVGLAFSDDQIESALDTAFSYDEEVIVEQYIPLGREIRIGCIETEEGDIRVLPAIEYFVNQEEKIRLPGDKFVIDDNGITTGWHSSQARKCPADMEPSFEAKLHDLVRKAHKAIGCRDYSIYDIRVDPEDNIYFLEASLYCSFTPNSAIILMSNETEDIDHQQLFRSVLRKAAARGKTLSSVNPDAKFSMKGKVLN